MYFNNFPQNFGQAPNPQPNIPQSPGLSYNQGSQGIGGLPFSDNNQQMAQPSNPAPQMQNGFGMAPPMGGTPPGNPTASTTGLGGKSITPLMPYQKHSPQPGQRMAKGGVVAKNLAKSGVVSAGIAALRGQHPNPRAALDDYDKNFGPDATAELMKAYADGGVVSGPGSGVADLVPGSIDGREDVRIASGEYVIPAWAVSTLGDGSTEAGARVLDAMVARLREAGSELIMGSDPINPSEFIPA